MGRLEKIAYERVFNSKLIGRARCFNRPVHSAQQSEELLKEWPKPAILEKLENWLFLKLAFIEYRTGREMQL